MNMVPFTMKLEKTQSKFLDAISKKTHVPKSGLIREGIELVIRKYQEDVITPELRQLIDKTVQEDIGLLRRLAKA